MSVPIDRRVPNLTLKAVRNSLRLSQDEFATALQKAGAALGEPNGCTRRLVQRWEDGESTYARPRYRRALQSVTQVSYTQLGFAGTAMKDPFAHAPLSIPQMPVVGTESAVEAGPHPGDRLGFALRQPETADLDSVTVAELTLNGLFDAERSEPARVLAPRADQHLARLATLLTGTRDARLRRRLALAAGYCAALAGWLACDMGATVSAHRYWTNALDAAAYTADTRLSACVFTYQAYAAEERGDPDTAWRLAQSASAQAGDDPRATAWTQARAAYYAAVIGATSAATFQLGQAKESSAQIPHEVSALSWVRGVDRCALHTQLTAIYRHLGDRDGARESLTVLRSLIGTDQIKTHALALAEAARTAMFLDETDLACEMAAQAAPLTEGFNLTIARRALLAVTKQLAATTPAQDQTHQRTPAMR